MKILSMLLWVGQFGLSILMPPCVLLYFAVWLRNRFGLGMWIIAVLGVLGLLIAFSTAKANLKALRRDADAAADREPPPVAFNDHH